MKLGDVLASAAENERFARDAAAAVIRTYGEPVPTTPDGFTLAYARNKAADYLVLIYLQRRH